LGRGIWQVFFVCVWLDLSRDFLGIQNNFKILGSADCVVRLISCNPFWKFGMGLFWGLIFGPGIFFGGFVASPRDFFGF